MSSNGLMNRFFQNMLIEYSHESNNLIFRFVHFFQATFSSLLLLPNRVQFWNYIMKVTQFFRPWHVILVLMKLRHRYSYLIAWRLLVEWQQRVSWTTAPLHVAAYRIYNATVSNLHRDLFWAIQNCRRSCTDISIPTVSPRNVVAMNLMPTSFISIFDKGPWE